MVILQHGDSQTKNTFYPINDGLGDTQQKEFNRRDPCRDGIGDKIKDGVNGISWRRILWNHANTNYFTK